MFKKIIQFSRNLKNEIDEAIFKNDKRMLWFARIYLFWKIRLYNFLVKNCNVWMLDSLNITLSLALKKNDVFIDAGANVGWVTERAAFCTNNKTRIYSIEPSPSSYNKLKMRVSALKLNNVQLIQNALGNTEGDVPFYEFEENHGGASSLKEDAWPGHKPDKVTHVAIRTLDDIIKEFNIEVVKLIKIDVQGSECNLLKGGTILFGKISPIVYIEVEEYALKAFGSTIDEMLGLIHDYQYQMYSWRENELKRVNSRGDISESGHDDLICIKSRNPEHQRFLKKLKKIRVRKNSFFAKAFAD